MIEFVAVSSIVYVCLVDVRSMVSIDCIQNCGSEPSAFVSFHVMKGGKEMVVS